MFMFIKVKTMSRTCSFETKLYILSLLRIGEFKATKHNNNQRWFQFKTTYILIKKYVKNILKKLLLNFY